MAALERTIQDEVDLWSTSSGRTSRSWRRILFDPQSHQVFMSAMEPLGGSTTSWRRGWAKNAADTLTQSVPITSRRRWGLRCWTSLT